MIATMLYEHQWYWDFRVQGMVVPLWAPQPPLGYFITCVTRWNFLIAVAYVHLVSSCCSGLNSTLSPLLLYMMWTFYFVFVFCVQVLDEGRAVLYTLVSCSHYIFYVPPCFLFHFRWSKQPAAVCRISDLQIPSRPGTVELLASNHPCGGGRREILAQM